MWCQNVSFEGDRKRQTKGGLGRGSEEGGTAGREAMIRFVRSVAGPVNPYRRRNIYLDCTVYSPWKLSQGVPNTLKLGHTSKDLRLLIDETGPWYGPVI